jgi:uncharacterized damage-inducible protein DinB
MEHVKHPPAPPTRADGTPNPMLSLMRYKRWADAELMSAVLAHPTLGAAPDAEYVPVIIRHFHTVDCIFKAHLLGLPHAYSSANPAEPAALADLQQQMREVDDWYVEYTLELTEHQLGQALQVKFTDGDQRVLTRSDILLHVSLHGAYHRGNVGVLLQKCGAAPPPDGFASYLSRARDVRTTAP